jgi:hypothetical protein
MSTPGGGLALQARRLRWVLQDVRAIVRGTGRALRLRRPPAAGVAIGVLEGATRAIVGSVNAYRIRLVNDMPDAVGVTLALHGTGPGGRTFETTATCRLDGRRAHEVFLATDWVAHFALASVPPPVDDVAFLGATPTAERCRLTATLAVDTRRLDTLTIAQPLAA